MFSIYSHVRHRNRPQSPDDFDSDAQTPTPPRTFAPSQPSQTATVPRPGQASSLPGPTRPSSRVDLPRNSAPAFAHPQQHPKQIAPATILFPSKASEPSTSDEEEAAEAPAIEEFLAGDSPDRDARWAKEAVVKREVSPVPRERTEHPTPRPEHSSITPSPSSRKEHIFNQHRGFLLSIKRSLRGRILSNAPVGDRTIRNLRYVSPFTVDDLQDFYNRRRRGSAERLEEVNLEVPVASEVIEREDFIGLPKRLRLGTPEAKKERQRGKSGTVSSRHTSVRKARVEKPEGKGVAARRSKAPTLSSPSKSANIHKLATMLTDPATPDTEIAPLVTTWTNTLLSKIDTLTSSLAEKDDIISALESEADALQVKVEDAASKVRNMQASLAKLEPASGENEALKKQIEVLAREKKGDQQKVQNLNIQLSTLARQGKVDRKAAEKRELALVKQMEQQRGSQQQANMEKAGNMAQKSEVAPSPSVAQGGGDRELQAKYDALEIVAKEVAKHCGAMAGDNFGPFGSSLANLKRHMGE